MTQPSTVWQQSSVVTRRLSIAEIMWAKDLAPGLPQGTFQKIVTIVSMNYIRSHLVLEKISHLFRFLTRPHGLSGHSNAHLIYGKGTALPAKYMEQGLPSHVFPSQEVVQNAPGTGPQGQASLQL